MLQHPANYPSDFTSKFLSKICYRHLESSEIAFPVFLPGNKADNSISITLSDNNNNSSNNSSDNSDDSKRALPDITIGKRAVVANFSDFKRNFDEFTQNQLKYLNWDNVVCAGLPLLPLLR